MVDLAAGTGKLTRLLTPLTGTVTAIEPSAAMLAALRRLVPDAQAVAGTAEVRSRVADQQRLALRYRTEVFTTRRLKP